MGSETFTLAQLARVVGMTIDEAVSYRDSGLLQQARRQRGRTGDRAYHGEHVARLRFIKRALELGYTTADLVRLVDTTRLVTCSDVYAITARRVQQLRQQEDAQLRATALEQLAATCPRIGGRDECPILASIAAGAR